MRNIWSRICTSPGRTISRPKPARTRTRLGLELLEGRVTPTTTASLDVSGNLLIEDTGGGNTNDNLTIKSDTANAQFVISDPVNVINTSIAGATGSGTTTVLIPFSSVSGSAILVNTFAGDDLLTVDLGLGNFAKTITYAGGVQGAGGDELTLQGGGTFANVTHTFSSASAGSVAVTDNALISYSGLEPVTDNLSANDRVFTFTGGTESITLSAPVGTPFDLVIDSTLGEFVFFTNPTNSLTINAGSGDDTVNVNGVRPSFAASLTIHGGAGHDTVNLNNDITFAANRNLDVDLQNDNDANPGTDRIAVAANANYVLSGTGTATLTASSSISFAPGSSLITADGVLNLEANGPGTGDANFTGIFVNGATVQSTGSGAVQVLGRGGVGGSNNHGVRVVGAAVIQSGTGPLQMLGTGGISSGSPNPGVAVEGPGALISSAGGNIQVTGTGGGAGGSFGNSGVVLRSAQIIAGGAGTVTVLGTAGTNSGGPNRGVEMTNSTISSSGGNVQVTGVGGAHPQSATNGTNIGVLVDLASQISAGGTGTVTVHGTGSLAGGIDNHGVVVSGANTRITSGGGNIQVTGIHGAAGPSTPSFGINVLNNGSVVAGNAADIELISDSMNIAGDVNGGLNTVTLRQRSTGTAITTNVADSTGVLGLTDAELDRVTGSELNIGDINAGVLTVSGTVSRGAPTLMTLTTGSDIALLGLLVDQFAVVNLNAPSGAITTPAGGSPAAPDVRAATVNVDGAVAPGGASAGELAVDGSLVFSSTDRYRAQLNGASAFSQYDVISVTGTANLGAATLEVLPTFTPSIGQLFTIVNTSGGVAGTFRDTSGNPLNEGATFVANGITFSITYQGGGDGRDVVLRAETTGLTISISDASVVETNAGTTTITFNVTLSGPGNQTIAVNWATANGTATTADNDYVGASGTVAFGVGETSKPVTITVNGDVKFEPNETFVVNLSNAVGATIGDNQGVGTIINDDSQPTISIDDAFPATEGNSGTTSAVFTVSLSNPTSQVVTVDFTTVNGTATALDGDYVPGSGTLTFPAGVTSQQVTVVINGDTQFEPNESFFVELSNPSNATILDSQGAGIISNDDTMPTVSINDVALPEGNAGTTSFVFTVSLSNASWQTVIVIYTTANGTATTQDGDYQAAGAILSFAPGQTSQTVTVQVQGDLRDEINETFFVNLSNPSNVTILDGQGVGTIIDDDAPPSLSINDVTVTEGNAGSVSATFTASLSQASGQTVTVNFTTADGSATVADSDYQNSSGTLTFTPGQTTQTVTVVVNGDTKFESNETFAVNLSSPTNATIADITGLGTIQNDDGQPTISIDDVSLLEGNGPAQTSFVFTVSLSNASSQPINVNFRTEEGTATLLDGDYEFNSGTLTFTPGQTSRTITVLVNRDSKFEADETFTVNLSNPTNATIADGVGLGTIRNDDTRPTISITDQSLPEGNSGTTSFTFIVTLSNPTTETVTVNFATADGTATLVDGDYVTSSGTLVFTPPQLSHTITVLVNGDTKFEAPSETFFVNLSGATNATILDDRGQGTIVNDDNGPAISINDVSMPEGNTGTTSFVFTVSLSNASSQTVTINYTTADVSATVADNDYQPTSGTLTYAPGQTSQTVTVLVNGDTKFEPDETFRVQLSNASGAGFLDGIGVGTIQNDDNQPTISINDVSLAEGNSGTTAFVFTVSLSNASAQAITVNFATADGSATLADSDYQGSAGSVTFAPGTTSQTITVLVNGDTKFEPDETFTVNLSAATNATIADGTGLGTIRNDDNQPSISINDVSLLEGNSGTTAFVFTVSLSNASAQAITVNFATADGSATLADTDYQGAAGSVTFAPGTTSQTLTVLVNGDTKFEPDETFTVNLSAAVNANIADGTGLGTIRNDDNQPTISINDVSLLEGNSGTTAFGFTVSLSNPSAQPITVNFATADGSATLADNDYQSAGGTVTFAPGQTSQTVTVLVNGDTTTEVDETFNVNLSGATNATIADPTGLGTIRNDDGQPTISINDVSLLEGNVGTTSFVFTVSLSNPSTQPITVNFATADGTATVADGDYQSNSGSVTFAPGQTSQTVTVLVNGDTKFEPDETFTVNLSGAVNAIIADGIGLGTIRNDDNQPSISINDVSLLEGNSGTTAFVFTVSLANASAQAVTVNFATADGSATLADSDYQGSAGSVTFAPGTTSQTITVLVNGDTKFEPDETFTVNLSAATNATIADGTGLGTIRNDDGQPSISINDVSLLEGNSGTTAFVFTVSLSNASAQPITVSFATADGSATLADNDYQSAGGTVTFAPGQTSQTVTVLVNGDTTTEADETFNVNLSGSANATIADSTGLGTIRNDDGQPTISINDVTLPEGNSGTTSFVFTVSLSNSSSQPITVNFATADGTATTADSDYQGGGGTVAFAPGQTSQTITVLVNGDTKFEPHETFTVNLSGATNATIGDGAGVGTIRNDDNQPSISINDVSLLEGNTGATSFVFTVSLSNASAQAVTVNFATADGSATLADSDYQGGAGSVTFAPGTTSQTITVLVNGDTKFEGDETFTVNLSAAVNATIADGSGLGTIRNDDAQPTISINDVSRPEGNSGTTSFGFTVSLSNASAQPITVNFAAADGTATLADNDYQGAAGTVTFAPGQTSQTVTVQVNSDTKFEPDETFTVSLSGATNATIADGSGVGTIRNDDGQPALRIDDVSHAEGNSGTTAYIFTVTLSNASSQTITVAYATADGSATLADGDYQAAGGTLTFTPGDTSETFTVLVNGDVTVEPDETFLVQLSATTGATIADGQGQGTIVNDDPDEEDGGTIELVNGVLTITGTSGDDRVHLNRHSSGKNAQIRVHASFLEGRSHVSFDESAITRIVINLRDGDDQASITGKIDIDVSMDGEAGDDRLSTADGAAILRGGTGNDILLGGSADDVLIGGDGCDVLDGGSGRDLLIGGADSDWLDGGHDDDILIAGTTNHDANDRALLDIMNEWTSSHSFQQRVNNLKNGSGGGSGGPKNGTTFLNSLTVHDDDAVDVLRGDGGSDWFLYNFSGGGVMDIAIDVSGSESGVRLDI